MVEQGAHGTVIRLEQKGRAGFNVVFGLAMVAGGLWMRTREDLAGFGVALLIFGVLYAFLAWMAAGQTRITRVGPESVVLERKKGQSSDEWPRDRVAAVRLDVKRKKGSGDSGPLPWRVTIEDAEGNRFKGRYTFQDERVARAFAQALAGTLSVEIEEST